MEKQYNKIISSKDSFMKLTNAALLDGKITDEEQALIDNFLINMSTYEELLRIVMEDGHMDGAEKIKLFKARQAIKNAAKRISEKDGVISDDEQLLIDKIEEIVKLIEDIEG